jgi:hypothetical protein
MITRTLALAAALVAIAPMAHAQEDKPDEALVQKLLDDPKALTDALAHCDPKSMTMDRECRAAHEARERQFFDTGVVPYTPQKVIPFPNTPDQQPFNPPPQK